MSLLHSGVSFPEKLNAGHTQAAQETSQLAMVVPSFVLAVERFAIMLTNTGRVETGPYEDGWFVYDVGLNFE